MKSSPKHKWLMIKRRLASGRRLREGSIMLLALVVLLLGVALIYLLLMILIPNRT